MDGAAQLDNTLRTEHAFTEKQLMNYFIHCYQWADEEDIEIIYFSSFDESWKVGDEGDVGAYWGLWDKDGKLKYV